MVQVRNFVFAAGMAALLTACGDGGETQKESKRTAPATSEAREPEAEFVQLTTEECLARATAPKPAPKPAPTGTELKTTTIQPKPPTSLGLYGEAPAVDKDGCPIPTIPDSLPHSLGFDVKI